VTAATPDQRRHNAAFVLRVPNYERGLPSRAIAPAPQLASKKPRYSSRNTTIASTREQAWRAT